MMIGNPYVHYYLEQQRGCGMPVFRGSAWQAGYGNQTGYGLGGMFCSMSRAALPLLRKGVRAVAPLAKKGARILGDIAMQSGTNFLGDILTGKKTLRKRRKHGQWKLRIRPREGPLVNYEVRYLETLLNYGPAAKNSQLTTALYYKDTAGKMDAAD